jgi:hypothetical protein
MGEVFFCGDWCRKTRLRAARLGLDLDPKRKRVLFHGAVVASYTVEDGVLVLADLDPSDAPLAEGLGLRMVY